MESVFIGVDTSNYTTSVALVDRQFRVLLNCKLPLPVGDGERGLRQSDALFAHTKQLPDAISALAPHLVGKHIAAVGVSTRPRNVTGSYMPCFLAGVSAANAAAAASGVPLFCFSHQCGHMMAALLSAGRLDLADSEFAAYHVSGGTTELLLVSPDGVGFHTEIVGGTADISAGQLIDRVGVAMGLAFPAGAEMEKLALAYAGRPYRRKPVVRDCRVNLSGIENIAMKLYRESGDKGAVAAFVFSHLAECLTMMTEECFAEYGERPLLCAGGVMSSAMLRRRMESRFSAMTAEPALSSDNAVGIAALAARACMQGGDIDAV